MDGSAVHMSSIGRWAGKMDQVGFIFLRGPGPGPALARPVPINPLWSRARPAHIFFIKKFEARPARYGELTYNRLRVIFTLQSLKILQWPIQVLLIVYRVVPPAPLERRHSILLPASCPRLLQIGHGLRPLPLAQLRDSVRTVRGGIVLKAH